MEHALAGNAVAQADEVSRSERTGLPLSAIEAALKQAQAKGLITRDFARVRPTERGFDFLSDLQALFLSNPA